jgi:hypothetical protein
MAEIAGLRGRCSGRLESLPLRQTNNVLFSLTTRAVIELQFVVCPVFAWDLGTRRRMTFDLRNGRR